MREPRLAAGLSRPVVAFSGPRATSTTVPAAREDGLAGSQRAAVDDLARRLGVPAASIKVIAAGTVTWPDGSLGCPQPGRTYTHATVDGYRVVVGHENRIYAYHAAVGAAPFLCPSGEKDGGYDFVPPPGFDD